jgi:UDP-N-acetylmuramate--alanine ligase
VSGRAVRAVGGVEDLGRVHLIGIGGAGMSGIARILLARGVPVSGSDARDSAAVQGLRAAGAAVHVGHDAAHVEHLGDGDTVVVSSAVRAANPELVAGRARGAAVLHRSEALAALMAGRRAVAVAGTHGKTTTTSMLTVALQHAGADPSFAIGGELTDGGAGAHHGGGDVFVAEADESDGSFLRYSPTVAVVTNVEPDHLDHYGTPEAVAAAFDAFCDRVVPGGLLVACVDDPGAAAMAAAARARRPDLTVVGYGGTEGADVRIEDLRLEPDGDGVGARFVLRSARGAFPLTLRVPGRHNAANAAAAFAAATGLGLDPHRVLAGLAAFGGARRRFEVKGTADGVRVVDDYAHHPTEVTAVLTAARAVAGQGRVVAVFQPHLFSRTRLFAREFGAALGLADEVLVTAVYAAREDPEPGVTGALVADAVPPPTLVHHEPDAAAVPQRLLDLTRPGDLVLTVGAGDVTAYGPALLGLLRARQERRTGSAPLPVPVGESGR